MIEIVEHVQYALSYLPESTASAFSVMSDGVLPFFTDEALVEMAEDETLAPWLALAGYEIQLEGRAADAKHWANSKAHTAELYKHLPDEVTKHGHEANVLGLRAMQMHASPTAKPEQKTQAHEDAKEAHAHAAKKFAAHPQGAQAAAVHQRAVGFHNSQVDALGVKGECRVFLEWDEFDKAKSPKHIYHWSKNAFIHSNNADSPRDHALAATRHETARDNAHELAKQAKEPEHKKYLHDLGDKHQGMADKHKRLSKWMASPRRVESITYGEDGLTLEFKAPDLSDVPSTMHRAQAKMALLAKKNKAGPKIKPTPAPPPRDESIEEASKVHPAVRRASGVANKASAETKKPYSGAGHEDTARRKHLIAAGISKAFGHRSRSGEHLDAAWDHTKRRQQARLNIR